MPILIKKILFAVTCSGFIERMDFSQCVRVAYVYMQQNRCHFLLNGSC